MSSYRTVNNNNENNVYYLRPLLQPDAGFVGLKPNCIINNK